MYYVVFYHSYGEWKCTIPFKSLREATKHQAMYLDPKDYVDAIRMLEIELDV